MTGDNASRKRLSSEPTSPLEALNRLFARALYDAKLNSALSALSQLRTTKAPRKKLEIMDERFREWKLGTKTAIREYVPKYLALAEAHPEFVRGDIFQWIEDVVWERLEKGCGAQRLGSPVKPVSDVMKWWFAVACEGNFKVNLPSAEPWVAPIWLRNKSKGTEWVLRLRESDLSIGFYDAIAEELDKASVQHSIGTGHKLTEDSGSSQPHAPLSREHGSGPTNETNIKLGAIIKKVENPSQYTVVTTPEAAQYFDVKSRTIYRWIEEDKLQAGPKRGTVKTASMRKLQRSRSKGQSSRKEL